MKFILILILFTYQAFAFDDLELQKTGSESQEFVQLSDSLSKTKVLKASFDQIKKIKVLRRPLKSSGKLIFDRNIGVFWQLQKPFKSTVTIDKEKLTSIDDNGKKVVIKADDKPMLYGFTKIFMSVFSANTDEMKEHFEIYYSKDSQKWKIGLIPNSSQLKKVISKILLSGAENTVSKITLWETNGDKTDITFSGIIKLDKLDENDRKKFEF